VQSYPVNFVGDFLLFFTTRHYKFPINYCVDFSQKAKYIQTRHIKSDYHYPYIPLCSEVNFIWKEVIMKPKPSEHLTNDEARRNLDFIINGSTEYAIIGTELDGQVFLWNAGAQRIYGYLPGEVVGKLNSSILYSADDAASGKPAEIMTMALREKKWEGTLTHARKSGEHFPAHLIITPKLGSNNEPLGLLIISKDISDEIRLAEELKSVRVYTQTLEEKFNGLLESAPDAIVIVDGSGMILMVNAQTESLFGYNRSVLAGKPVEILIPDRFQHIHPRHREKFANEPQLRPMGIGLDLYGLRADGEEFPVEISLSPLQTEGGLLTVAAIRDVTRRQRAEKKFRGLLESAPDAMVVVDKLGIINIINSQTEKLFGYGRAEIIGQTIETLVPKRFRKKHVKHREVYYVEHPARPMGIGMDLFGLRKNGTEFPIEISLSPLETEDGLLVIAAIRDITERKRAEADIQKLNHDLKQRAAQLETANYELEAFSYSVSHDLRAPLRSIDGFSHVLLEDYSAELPPEGREYLERVRAAAQRMADLIDDLLKLARVTRTPLEPKLTNLSAMAEKIANTLKEQNPKRNVTYSIMPDLMVSGDPRLLNIALENLLSNAWKFTAKKEHAIIEFGQQSKTRERTFFVRDNGSGFDMAYVNKLFGVFQRLHSASEYPGTGVGLATVRRIIKIHGGNIWAEGEEGKGAAFYFTL
jgi:PAS domain S-box-containing protein